MGKAKKTEAGAASTERMAVSLRLMETGKTGNGANKLPGTAPPHSPVILACIVAIMHRCLGVCGSSLSACQLFSGC